MREIWSELVPTKLMRVKICFSLAA